MHASDLKSGASIPSTGSQAKGCTCDRVRKVARRLTSIYDRALAPHGLTVNQFSLMAHAAASQVTVSELAQRLEMDRSTLTRNLEPLVAMGWVKLERHGDRRRKWVALTELGLSRHQQAKPSWRAAQGDVESLLGPTVVLQLHQVLDFALVQLKALSEDTPHPSAENPRS